MHLMFETLNESGTAFERCLPHGSDVRQKAKYNHVKYHIDILPASCKATAPPDAGNVSDHDVFLRKATFGQLVSAPITAERDPN